ncbi:MAG: Phosphatidylglycerophosphatase A [Alphaproteobacteria bacterium MarineAlpha9_Bin3]|nr:MAG: Phosphatidylglycerophosphatase A [Alphaproteobacteria bacterium MarineAlpha9_Bin3]|tara:strand:- start:45772 stop:46227 length:456 start_codon:yes stop_codon:yes gene_type:complete
MNKFNLNKIFVSVFGIGYIPYASGTFGSIAGLIIGYLIYLINYNLLFLLIPLLFILGIKASQIYQNKTGELDSKVIVIDEVVGQLIAMMTVIDDLLLLFLSFIIFRIFDIFKPWPASYFDQKMKNGKGVMLDDVIAGIYTLITISFIDLLI